MTIKTIKGKLIKRSRLTAKRAPIALVVSTSNGYEIWTKVQ